MSTSVENNLVCNTPRNEGLTSPKHLLKLQCLLEQAIEFYSKPAMLHYRVSLVNHEDHIEDLTAYVQNRCNRKGIRFSFVKATENNTDGSYLHQHWFCIIDLKNPDLSEQEVLDEFHQCFWGLRNNGLIYSFLRNNKKVEGEYGTTWDDYETAHFPLTPLTLYESLRWASYALKNRSKCVPGRKRVSFSMPRPAGERSTRGRQPSVRACLRRHYYGF